MHHQPPPPPRQHPDRAVSEHDPEGERHREASRPQRCEQTKRPHLLAGAVLAPATAPAAATVRARFFGFARTRTAPSASAPVGVHRSAACSQPGTTASAPPRGRRFHCCTARSRIPRPTITSSADTTTPCSSSPAPLPTTNRDGADRQQCDRPSQCEGQPVRHGSRCEQHDEQGQEAAMGSPPWRVRGGTPPRGSPCSASPDRRTSPKSEITMSRTLGRGAPSSHPHGTMPTYERGESTRTTPLPGCERSDYETHQTLRQRPPMSKAGGVGHRGMRSARPQVVGSGTS